MLLQKLAANSLGKIAHVSSCRHFCVIHDRSFEYFRKKSEYKNSVVQLSNDLNQSKVGPGCSFFLKDHNLKVEDYFSHLNVRQNVMRLTAQQVKDLLFLMANIKIDVAEYGTILDYLDEKCALSVEKWPLDLVFYILDAWFIIWGIKMFRKHYFSAVTSLWGRRMNKVSKNNLILLLYFIGMSKEAPPFLMDRLEDRMEDFASDFSEEEWAVACLSFFKISQRINSSFLLNHSCNALVKLLEKDDRFHAISILKCLRLSKHFDGKVWLRVKDYVHKECSNFNFVECTNFLATFANQNIHDQPLFDTLEEHGISCLQSEQSMISNGDLKTHPSIRSRPKDIARFIWSLSCTGHNFKPSSLQFIGDFLKHRLDSGEFDLQWNILIDCMQSLILVGFYSCEILLSVLSSDSLKKLHLLKKSKPKYQLYFVQKSVLIEKPEFEMNIKNLFNPIPKSLEKDVSNRHGFKDLVDILNTNSDVNFSCCYIMPHIMIAGVLVGKKKKMSNESAKKSVDIYKKYLNDGLISRQAQEIFEDFEEHFCLEVLDPTVCVNNGREPHGLMKTKIRQLEKLKIKVITLFPEEINEMSKKSTSEKINAILSSN